VVPVPPAVSGQTHLVPTKAILLLERMIGTVDEDAPIQVFLSTNDVLFRTDKTTLYSRLVEGRYPPYANIVAEAEKKAKFKIPIPVGKFHTAVKQAAIMTDDESIKTTFKFEKNKLTLQSHGQTTGRAKVEMPVEFAEGNIGINFDPAYIVQMLNVFDKSEVLTLDLADANKPALFHSGDDCLVLVMPLA
jgi:DNA polymerase III subunit beta